MRTPFNVALAMSADTAKRIFPPAMLAAVGPDLVLLSSEPLTSFEGREADGILQQADALITGWGCPPVTAGVLARAPRLRYVLHSGGTVKDHITDAVWQRGITVSTAAEANSIPVAEYTLAMILLANKKVLQLASELRRHRSDQAPDLSFPAMGNYGKTIGLVGASKIGRKVIELLRPFDFDVLVADPFLSEAEAMSLGVTSVELDDLMGVSDVISLHAPDLPETLHMLDERRLGLIRPGATFINTARGALVDQDALTRRIQRGDLFAVLDVTTPWVLEQGNPLYDHPNVLLTPHMAGSLGVELERLAVVALEEATRAAQGVPLLYPLDATVLSRTA
jgi:phosphoglycerate dehydrogenase-like enzyme